MRGDAPSRAVRDAACIALLCALGACVFRAGLDPRSPVVFGHYTQGDVVTQFYPWKQFAAGELRRGALPLWNPYILCGYPFVASWQSAVFYPPNIASLLLPVHAAINWGFAAHVVLAGVFAFLFVRYAGGSRFASSVAAVSFMLSSVLLLRVFAGHLSLVCAAAWFPLLLLSAERWLRSRRPRWALLGGGVVCLQLLAGHPQVAYYSVAGAVLHLAFRILFSPRGGRMRASAGAVVFVALAVSLGAALAAVQILPGLELIRNSARGAEAGTASRMVSFPPENLLTFAVPDAFGDFVNVFCWGRRFLWGEAVYFGVLPLVCALCALFFRRDGLTRALACLAVVSLALMLGSRAPLAASLADAIPGISMVQGPTKALFVTVFALSCLAGLGAECLIGRRAAGWRVAAVLLLVAAACLLDAWRGEHGSIAWRALLSYRKGIDPGYWRVLDAPAFVRGAYGIFREGLIRLALLCAASAGALAYASRASGRARGVRAIILAVIVADLWSYHARFLTTISVSACRWPAGIVRFFAREGGVGRVFRDGRLAVPAVNQNMIDRIASYDGYETDRIRAFAEFSDFFRLGSGNAAELLLRPETLKMASLADIRYQIVPASMPDPGPRFPLRYEGRGVRIRENPGALPRAFVAHRAVTTGDSNIALALLGMPLFDPSSQAVLDEAPRPAPRPAGAPSEAVIEKYEPGEVAVRCRCAAPGILVLTDAWYPGWEAAVDGIPARILRADHAFRGVALGAGAHRVIFKYRPASFRVGAAVSAATLAAFAAAGLFLIARGSPRRRS